ncbi:MAG: intradiol ring-cleavage dioxygenase [Cyclobacteriaceae bacterium]
MKSFHYVIFILAMTSCYGQRQTGKDRQVGGPCEDCDLIFAGMPENLDWQTQLASPAEPGEKLVVRGTVYHPDGKTPAVGVILYVYHTDHTGRYSPAPGQTHARRHGQLRGWMKTDSKGRYEFTTIRPAAYPNRKDPQHIHPLIKEEGKSVYWIDEFLFADDPLVTQGVRSNQQRRGGNGIVELTKLDDGSWLGRRDIILGKNIPNY